MDNVAAGQPKEKEEDAGSHYLRDVRNVTICIRPHRPPKELAGPLGSMKASRGWEGW